ncbi:hypothetical protein A0H81_12966 [Grifola frondosa]|uniref:Uncharacterized protein n=1 Tax=Grifola frondosa TaxID=5627 RepID=A0A1C7LQX5_GRIFR|nr:hypothetical protein A0H81_12966 [Grifola frondosa]
MDIFLAAYICRCDNHMVLLLMDYCNASCFICYCLYTTRRPLVGSDMSNVIRDRNLFCISKNAPVFAFQCASVWKLALRGWNLEVWRARVRPAFDHGRLEVQHVHKCDAHRVPELALPMLLRFALKAMMLSPHSTSVLQHVCLLRLGERSLFDSPCAASYGCRPSAAAHAGTS